MKDYGARVRHLSDADLSHLAENGGEGYNSREIEAAQRLWADRLSERRTWYRSSNVSTQMEIIKHLRQEGTVLEQQNFYRIFLSSEKYAPVVRSLFVTGSVGETSRTTGIEIGKVCRIFDLICIFAGWNWDQDDEEVRLPSPPPDKKVHDLCFQLINSLGLKQPQKCAENGHSPQEKEKMRQLDRLAQIATRRIEAEPPMRKFKDPNEEETRTDPAVVESPIFPVTVAPRPFRRVPPSPVPTISLSQVIIDLSDHERELLQAMIRTRDTERYPPNRVMLMSLRDLGYTTQEVKVTAAKLGLSMNHNGIHFQVKLLKALGEHGFDLSPTAEGDEADEV